MTVTPRKVIVALMLNNGTTTTGSVKTKSLRIGGSSQDINVTEYTNASKLDANRTKVLALASALGTILSKSTYYISEQTENQLTN